MRHNIESLIEQSSNWGDDGVPLAVRRTAFSAIASHPNYAAAIAHPFCKAAIMYQPKSFFDNSSWPAEIKSEIFRRLNDVDAVLLLALVTSDEEHNGRWMGGESFDFVLHPKSFEVLHSALGTWRT